MLGDQYLPGTLLPTSDHSNRNAAFVLSICYMYVTVKHDFPQKGLY